MDYMIYNIGFYTLFPTLSAISCLFLLKKLIDRNLGSAYILLFSNLAVMNIAQATGYLLFPQSLTLAEYAADAYLISAYFFFSHLVFFALSLSNKPAIQRQTQMLLYIPPLILTLLHLSGLMIESYRVDHNSLMHNDGPLAWCFDAFILISCFAAVSFLFQNLKQHKDDRILISKNIIALLSFVPLILTFFVLILPSKTPYAIPVAIVGPSITLYTAITFYYLSRDKVADLSIGVVFFFNRLKLAYQLLETDKTKTDLKQFNKDIEKQFIKETLVATDGNIQAAADHLKVNHTTLRNKIKEYDLLTEKSSDKTQSLPTR